MYTTTSRRNLFYSLANVTNIKYKDEINHYIWANKEFVNFNQFQNTNTLYGGGKRSVKTKIFAFNNKEFVFTFDGMNTISVKNILDDDINCMVITINKKRKYAILEDLSFYYSCSNPATKNGDELITLCIKFLKQHKVKYGINKIILQDNSTKTIKKCVSSSTNKSLKKFKLSINYFVLNGNTWYGKYGFLPFDQSKNDTNEEELMKYKINQEILQKTKVYDLFDFFNKYSFIKKSKKYYDQNISVFLKNFLKKFPQSECKFSDMTEDIFNHLQLNSFFAKSFYLDL
jgi:hypothetical protein